MRDVGSWALSPGVWWKAASGPSALLAAPWNIAGQAHNLWYGRRPPPAQGNPVLAFPGLAQSPCSAVWDLVQEEAL